ELRRVGDAFQLVADVDQRLRLGDPGGGQPEAIARGTRFAETLTLFSTLPTLCSTLVATSAMPACLEASRNCCCRTSSRRWAATRSVTSRSMPTMRTPSPAGSPTTAATDSR